MGGLVDVRESLDSHSQVSFGMASRALAQFLVYGGGYLLRAFGQAYRLALTEASQGARSATSAGVKRSSVMSLSEARSILGLSQDASVKEVSTKFEHLHAANDPASGGSQYLRWKLLSAKQVTPTEHCTHLRNTSTHTFSPCTLPIPGVGQLSHRPN